VTGRSALAFRIYCSLAASPSPVSGLDLLSDKRLLSRLFEAGATLEADRFSYLSKRDRRAVRTALLALPPLDLREVDLRGKVDFDEFYEFASNSAATSWAGTLPADVAWEVRGKIVGVRGPTIQDLTKKAIDAGATVSSYVEFEGIPEIQRTEGLDREFPARACAKGHPEDIKSLAANRPAFHVKNYAEQYATFERILESALPSADEIGPMWEEAGEVLYPAEVFTWAKEKMAGLMPESEEDREASIAEFAKIVAGLFPSTVLRFPKNERTGSFEQMVEVEISGLGAEDPDKKGTGQEKGEDDEEPAVGTVPIKGKEEPGVEPGAEPPKGERRGRYRFSARMEQEPAGGVEPEVRGKEEPEQSDTEGSIGGPGVPDGTGPLGGTPACPMTKKEGEPEEEPEGGDKEEENPDPAGTLVDPGASDNPSNRLPAEPKPVKSEAAKWARALPLRRGFWTGADLSKVSKNEAVGLAAYHPEGPGAARASLSFLKTYSERRGNAALAKRIAGLIEAVSTERHPMSEAKPGSALYFLMDQLSNAMENFAFREGREEFVTHILSQPHPPSWTPDLIKRVFDAYWKLPAMKRGYAGFNWETWLNQQGIRESVLREAVPEGDTALILLFPGGNKDHIDAWMKEISGLGFVSSFTSMTVPNGVRCNVMATDPEMVRYLALMQGNYTEPDAQQAGTPSTGPVPSVSPAPAPTPAETPVSAGPVKTESTLRLFAARAKARWGRTGKDVEEDSLFKGSPKTVDLVNPSNYMPADPKSVKGVSSKQAPKDPKQIDRKPTGTKAGNAAPVEVPRPASGGPGTSGESDPEATYTDLKKGAGNSALNKTGTAPFVQGTGGMAPTRTPIPSLKKIEGACPNCGHRIVEAIARRFAPALLEGRFHYSLEFTDGDFEKALGFSSVNTPWETFHAKVREALLKNSVVRMSSNDYWMLDAKPGYGPTFSGSRDTIHKIAFLFSKNGVRILEGMIHETDPVSGGAGTTTGNAYEKPGSVEAPPGAASTKSKSEPQKEPEKPTENVPTNKVADQEKGGATGGIPCPNCKQEIPRDVVKAMLGQFMAQLGGQMLQGGTMPKPEVKGKEEPKPEEEPKPGEEQKAKEEPKPEPTGVSAPQAPAGPATTAGAAPAKESRRRAAKIVEQEDTAKVADYFTANPDPSDDEFHQWAKAQGMEVDDAEEAAYELATAAAGFFLGGKSKGGEPEGLDPKELEMGIKVEKEHTDDEDVARKIALDHLTEIPDYYTRLKKMEDEAKGGKNESSYLELKARFSQGVIAKGVSIKDVDGKAKELGGKGPYSSPDGTLAYEFATRISREIFKDFVRSKGGIASFGTIRIGESFARGELGVNALVDGRAVQAGAQVRVLSNERGKAKVDLGGRVISIPSEHVSLYPEGASLDESLAALARGESLAAVAERRLKCKTNATRVSTVQETTEGSNGKHFAVYFPTLKALDAAKGVLHEAFVEEDREHHLLLVDLKEGAALPRNTIEKHGGIIMPTEGSLLREAAMTMRFNLDQSDLTKLLDTDIATLKRMSEQEAMKAISALFDYTTNFWVETDIHNRIYGANAYIFVLPGHTSHIKDVLKRKNVRVMEEAVIREQGVAYLGPIKSKADADKIARALATRTDQKSKDALLMLNRNWNYYAARPEDGEKLVRFAGLAKEFGISETVQEQEAPVLSYASLMGGVASVKTGIKAPHVSASVSTLGGEKRASLMVNLSLDPKDTWENGIFQNSRYAQLHVDYNGMLEMFSGSIRPYLRKTRVTSVSDAVNKINQWIGKVTAEGMMEQLDTETEVGDAAEIHQLFVKANDTIKAARATLLSAQTGEIARAVALLRSMTAKKSVITATDKTAAAVEQFSNDLKDVLKVLDKAHDAFAKAYPDAIPPETKGKEEPAAPPAEAPEPAPAPETPAPAGAGEAPKPEAEQLPGVPDKPPAPPALPAQQAVKAEALAKAVRNSKNWPLVEWAVRENDFQTFVNFARATDPATVLPVISAAYDRLVREESDTDKYMMAGLVKDAKFLAKKGFQIPGEVSGATIGGQSVPTFIGGQTIRIKSLDKGPDGKTRVTLYEPNQMTVYADDLLGALERLDMTPM